MANQSKLKAWVRIDGGGTVVGSGPIFSLKKPKVGKWREMNANLCCNSVPTTTTTTTGGGSVTPTAWIIKLAYTVFGACENPYSTGVYYTNSSVITTGTIIYSDASLTTVASFNATYISTNNILYTVSNAVVTSNGTTCGSVTSTTWVTYVAGNQENACAQTGGWSFLLYTAQPTLGAGVVLYTDAILTTEFNSYQYASILYNNRTLYQLSDLPGDGTIVNVIGACPSVNSALFRESPNSNFVCDQPPSITLYWTGELTNMTPIFTDQARTQPYLTIGFVANSSTGAIFSTSNGFAFNAGFC